ncbi:MAG: hypothetical protein HKO66_03760 [Saprospiraceae bacterium]|nr:hypothetical protein [Bacteroidia bacterium]NNE15021.1 hypothetical protein [Saprospiraceae bacterium]NNL91329.1 hypothetical protein [Saprospiraceae bacterium]
MHKKKGEKTCVGEGFIYNNAKRWNKVNKTKCFERQKAFFIANLKF